MIDKDEMRVYLFKYTVILIQVILFFLKAAGVISWPWWQVFIPLFVYIVIVLICVLIVLYYVSK